MKLKSAYRYSSDRVFGVATAVEIQCSDDRDGIAETALATANKTAEFVGALVDRLHRSGVLKDRDILELLIEFEEAEER